MSPEASTGVCVCVHWDVPNIEDAPKVSKSRILSTTSYGCLLIPMDPFDTTSPSSTG